MSVLKSNLRLAISWLLIGALSLVIPATAAPPPGTLATTESVAAPTISLLPLDLAQIAALPRGAQQPTNPPTASGATAPPKHHISKWVWVAIVAGVGVGAGAGIIAGNKQSARVTAVSPTATVGAGGTVTAGPP